MSSRQKFGGSPKETAPPELHFALGCDDGRALRKSKGRTQNARALKMKISPKIATVIIISWTPLYRIAPKSVGPRLATIWRVRWSKTKYSPGVAVASSLSRQRAVSRSVTQSSQTGFPRLSFLNMSSWAEFIGAPSTSLLFL